MKSPTNSAKAEGLILRIGSILGLFCWALSALAVANGSLSGTVRDQTGGLIQGATITLVNVALKSTYTTASNVQGYYSFPTLPVGRYSMTVEAAGFTSQKKTDVKIDTDSALTVK